MALLRPGARVLVAPDKFKGTFTADAVAGHVADGLRALGHPVVTLPIADGGDGTAAVLRATLGGQLVAVDAHDALGRPRRAAFALLADGVTAVVDVAAASGIAALDPGELDAVAASSTGTGELIAAALARGARTVVVAAGGSATTDGGAGAIAVLGPGPLPARLVVACDVAIPWERAAPVFAPQKGADPAQVAALAARLDAVARRLPRDPRGVPRTGAAGGLSGGLWARYGAELADGAAYVLDAVGFDAHLAGADLVVTGEGALDGQTLHGKAVGAVAQRCRRAGVPCVAVVGRDRLAPGERAALGLSAVLQAGDAAAMIAVGQRLIRPARRG
jgi:glycerate kinase